MLEKLIKKMHIKVAFSFYGILSIITMLLPFVAIGFGIAFMITQTNQYGIMWIIIGLAALLVSLRRFKDYVVSYKYIFNPKKYPTSS